MKDFIRNIQRILSREEWNRLKILVLLDILISMLDIAFLALLIFVIHFYTAPEAADKYQFLDGPLFNNSSLALISVFFLLFSLKNFAGYLIHRAQSRFIAAVATRLSERQLGNYLEGRYQDYIMVDSAVNTRKIGHQPIDFAQHILGGVQLIITQSVLILLTIIVMITFNARIFLFLFLILLPPVIAVFYVIKRRLRSVRKNAQISIEKSWQHLREALSGFVESNIYLKNDFFLKRYVNRQRDFNNHVADMLIVQGIPSRMIEIFALLGLFFLIALNRWTSAPDSTAFITVGAFMAAAYKIIPGIVKILNTSGQMNNYAYTVNDLLASGNDGKGKPNSLAADPIQTIQFKNIDFRFNGQPLLKNLNFELRKGDFLGVSGCSGTGKTTMLNLLLGFLPADGGQIIFNAKRLDPLNIQYYWKNISYVKQQPFLIHDTVIRNIILDNPCNEEKLQHVINVTGLDELLHALPHGHDKLIMENGKNISGGQRQRIAIARALYKDADLIILDEPFNELDEKTELSFLSHFNSLSKQGKMIVLITHNKSSFSFCNKIISLDEQEG